MEVAVVGCGLAGLRSAMLLESKGHEVSLFEARGRPGGRLHTTEGGFEEGAEWVDEDHDRMRSLMRSLDVPEVAAPKGEYMLQFNNMRCLESSLWPNATRDLERFKAAATTGRFESIGELVDATCTSAEGRWMARANIRTDEGDEPERLGLKQWLAFREMYAQREGSEASAYRLGGGGSNFVNTLLGQIAARPTYGARLLRVEEAGEVRLTFDGFEAAADAVVLALPLPCLGDVVIDPPLHNQDELANLGFAPAVKARFHFSEPFWFDEGWHGYLKSDLLIQQTWPDREEASALVGYIVGDAARRLNESNAIEEALESEWQRWWPNTSPVRAEAKNWTADPHARGAFSLALPGSDPAAVRSRVSRRVQLAGEFCATWMGFMEGALESAETAVSALS